ncbi:phosphonopyruvate decarboxylase [Stappia sp. ES.058]|uniref:phosphonopyruvate decarboxylase n=1 Tax=Stappia sp. ES.058 TaxID=1881061 RepID=UPI00087A0BEE|nr:phosphonopyruvate decarboxylase [Stappia sp. ES.058]SDU33886.1 phosphonopyruvate decarboxylase [Stappia sp. ES.058]
MIEATQFLDAARRQGIDFFTGVPCSFLTPLMNAAISDARTCYVGATSEGEAVAIAAGAWLAGRETAVMFQNSGLGNAVNPITSLNHPFEIPSLMVVTWRGEPGLKDEPQHEMMGQITQSLLDLVGARRLDFPGQADEVEPCLAEATRLMGETGQPVALVQPKGAVASSGPLQDLPVKAGPRAEILDFGVDVPSARRIDTVETLASRLPEGAAIIATTGHTGRELFTLGDDPRNLYCVGSMGGASAIGLGAALNCEREIVVLDGDGAALMKLGNMATIGAQGPGNLTHVILDNGCHLSTGGQATVSPNVDFAGVAAACGYRFAARVCGIDAMKEAVEAALATPGPRLLHVKVSTDSVEGLGRPTVAPRDVARRFRAYLAGPSA